MMKKTTTTTMLRMIAGVYEAVFGLYAENIGKLLAIADDLPGRSTRTEHRWIRLTNTRLVATPSAFAQY